MDLIKNILMCIGLPIVLALFFIASTSSKTDVFNKVNNDLVMTNEIEPIKEDTLTLLDSVIIYIDELNLEHSDIVKAQMIIESGYAKRFVGFNLFGMNVAKQRPTTALNNKGYAEYAHWKDSVIDYALFQSAYCRKMKRDEYLAYICKNYAEDSKYCSKIEWIIKNKL